MERRKINVKKTSLRRELEMCVVACNKHLRTAVERMNIVILLRNIHPLFRSDYAYRLRNEGSITEEQSKEFIRFSR